VVIGAQATRCRGSDRRQADVTATGALIVLCTARWVRPIAVQPGQRAVAICASGAVTWDLHRDLLVAEAAVQPEAAAIVVDGPASSAKYN
jgi:hypothetical protein